MKSIFAAIIILLVSIQISLAQTSPKEKGLSSLTEAGIQAQLEFLSSDWMEGRETGTRGNLIAADYIASMFKLFALQPGGDIVSEELSMRDYIRGKKAKEYQSYFQTFPLIEYEPGDKQELNLISDNGEIISFVNNTDYKIYPSGNGSEITASIVFVGYGIKDEEKGYNDFSGVDVKGKFILRLPGYPGHKDTLSEAYKKFKSDRPYLIRRAKNNAAKELGAAGIIEVANPADIINWSKNEPFRINLPYYEGDTELQRSSTRMQIPGDTLDNDLPQISLSLRAANEIIKGSAISFSKFEGSVSKDFKSASKNIKGKSLNLIASVKSRIIKTRNVIAVLPGENTDSIIVVGGHYDHVGMRQGYIWNGSDDNASGTVGVMAIARAFAESGIKPKKTMVFAAWTGEEKGLLGSEYFANHSDFSSKNIMLNLNYDMISRNAANDSAGVECSMVYTKAYPYFRDIAEKNNDMYKLALKIEYRASDKPSGGSDHAPFAAKNIPVMYFMAGFHEDYHQPGDTIDKADIHKMTSIIKLGYLNLWELVNGSNAHISAAAK